MVLYPNVAALFLATTIRTALAASVLKLYTAVSSPLSPGTVKSDFTEATYDGYTAKTIANFLHAYIDPAGGASIQSGTQQFDYGPAAMPPVINTVLGFWLEDATGNLVVAGSFDNPIAMAAVGDSIPVNVILNYGA